MSTLSLRYARAFSQVAAAAHLDTDLAQTQLRDFAGTLGDSRPLREVMLNPSIPMPQKLKVLDAMAERLGMAREVRNFVAVMIAHHRLEELHEILREYAALADQQVGMSEAEIVTARPLNEADRAELEAQVAKLAGSRVRTTYSLDPTLLGGAVVKIGSTVHDGSLRAQLEQLKQTLTAAPVL